MKNCPYDAVRDQGLSIALKTPAEMAAMLPAEVEKWAAVIKAAHMVMD